MPQSLVQIYVHVVFSTKDRRPYLKDKDLRQKLHAYLVGACEGQGSPSVQIGGVEDHVHMLLRLKKTSDIAELVREVKRESSKWIKKDNAKLSSFLWQTGYGAFSVSPSHIAALTKYIKAQEEHHKQETFQDELRRICRKYGIEIDERYVWD